MGVHRRLTFVVQCLLVIKRELSTTLILATLVDRYDFTLRCDYYNEKFVGK